MLSFFPREYPQIIWNYTLITIIFPMFNKPTEINKNIKYNIIPIMLIYSYIHCLSIYIRLCLK